MMTRYKTSFHTDLDAIGEIRGLKRYWGKPVKHPANPLPGFPTDEVSFVTEQLRAFHIAVRHDDPRGVPAPRDIYLLLSSEHV